MANFDGIHPGQGEEIPEQEAKVSLRSQARRVALQALYQWQMTGDSTLDISKQFNEDGLLSKLDMTLFNDLLNSVSDQATDLDELIKPLLDRSINMIDPVERVIMRIGAYELRDKLEIPYRVVINESVELAKRFGAEDSHKYVNGILDKLAISLRSLEVSANKNNAKK